MVVSTKRLKPLIAAAAIAASATPGVAKDCYAPDALAQQRAFSRAVTTRVRARCGQVTLSA